MTPTKTLPALALSLLLCACDEDDSATLRCGGQVLANAQPFADSLSISAQALSRGFLRRGIPGTFDSYQALRLCNPDVLAGLEPGRYLVRGTIADDPDPASLADFGGVCCPDESFVLHVDDVDGR